MVLWQYWIHTSLSFEFGRPYINLWGKKSNIASEKLAKRWFWKEISFPKKKTVWSNAKDAFFCNIMPTWTWKADIPFFPLFYADEEARKHFFGMIIRWNEAGEKCFPSTAKICEKNAVWESVWRNDVFFPQVHKAKIWQNLVVFWRCTIKREKWMAHI